MSNAEYVVQIECKEWDDCWEDLCSYKTKKEALQEYKKFKSYYEELERTIRVVKVTTKLII